MNDSLKISVAMATFNGARFIAEQLESILAQTRLPDEIILSDDGSTDNTLEIAEQVLSSAAVPYRLLKNRYARGYASNFSTAFEAATGDIVFASDQDDFWLANKIEAVVDFIQASGAELVVHDSIVAWNTLDQTGLRLSEELQRRGLAADDQFFGCMMAFTRSLRDIVVPIADNAIGHDFLLNYFARARSSRRYLDQPLMIYRRHDKNVSTRAPVGEVANRSVFNRIAVAFDYDWLDKKRRLLREVHARVMQRPAGGEAIIPGPAFEQVQAELPRINLRANVVFDAGAVAAIGKLPAYLDLGLGWRRWLKDVVANRIVSKK